MILTINPGSTSTKIAVFNNDLEMKFEENLTHSNNELEKYNSISEQKEFRANAIKNVIKSNEVKISDLTIIVGRGGLVKPIAGGTYIVDDNLIKDLTKGVQGQHASNLGGIIAKEIADEIGVKAVITDPVVVDELSNIARISGLKDYPRKSIFHALNQKAILRQYCEDKNIKTEDAKVIITHMGGGVSVGYHENNQVLDVNNALGGQGPFSPERCGTLSPYTVLEMLETKEIDEVKKLFTGKGGMVDLLDTNNVKEISEKAEKGIEPQKLILDAMCYQIAKEIGALATINNGKIDVIILTGGIAYSEYVVKEIKNRVDFISDVVIYPGENEILALAQAGKRILDEIEQPKKY